MIKKKKQINKIFQYLHDYFTNQLLHPRMWGHFLQKDKRDRGKKRSVFIIKVIKTGRYRKIQVKCELKFRMERNTDKEENTKPNTTDTDEYDSNIKAIAINIYHELFLAWVDCHKICETCTYTTILDSDRIQRIE